MKKKILLIMPDYSSFSEIIMLNLEKMGYSVVCYDIKEFEYENLSDRLINFFRKTFLRNKSYKTFLWKKKVENDIKKMFSIEEHFHYVLVIRPDMCNIKTIQYLRKISDKVMAYQWDGFSRFENSEELIKSFDTFAVFDEGDCQNNNKKYSNLFLTQNFYFDIVDKANEKTIDILYVGAKDKGRYEIIKYLYELVKSLNMKSYFRLYRNTKKIQEYPIKITNIALPYKDLLLLSSRSKCIVDIKYPKHNGLSLRFFEALHFNQKIITDNKAVKKTDFYNPNNILVVDNFKKLTPKELEEFLIKEHIEISKEIKQKYSFENWFNTMIIS